MAQLCYRGTSYEKTISTLEVPEKQIIGKYRGFPCYSRTLKVSRYANLRFKLKYRGASYGLHSIPQYY